MKQLLSISRQKSYVLANYLNYDVSYISKWVTGSMLPAAKHADNICRKIAFFIVNNSDDTALGELKKLFPSTNTDYLQDEVYRAIFAAYQRSLDADDKPLSPERLVEDNSRTLVNPRLQKMYIKMSTNQVDDAAKKTNLALMTDLFSLGKEDKISISTADDGTGFINHLDEIHYLISMNKNLRDDSFDALLLTYMINSYADHNFKLFHYNHMPCSLLFAVQNQCMYLSLISENHRAIMSDTCLNKGIANEMYDTIISTERAFAKPMFRNASMHDLIREKHYLSFIISSNISLYMTKIDEMLLPTDLFEELLTQVSLDEDTVNELRNLHMMFQSALNFSNIRVAVLDRCLQEFALNGKMDFYGNNVVLSVNQRHRYLNHILSLIKQGLPTLKILLISSTELKDFSPDFAPCIYLSDCLSYVRLRSGKEQGAVRIMELQALTEVYSSFINHIFKNYNADSQMAALQLTSYLNMLKMLKN